MTKEEFHNIRFGAGMKAKYKGQGEYDITAVDWDQETIELDGLSSFWTKYMHVELIED